MELESNDSGYPNLFLGDSGKKGDADGKKKDKKDGGRYATLGESSEDDEIDIKSPLKTKKSKSFKFPSSKSKEKREKSRDKETESKKEKDSEKKKDKDKKNDVNKDKHKKERKFKSSGPQRDIAVDLPVFGAALSLSLERCPCHDGVNLSQVVRDCINFVEENGLSFEGVYKVNGNKTKVILAKKLYNQRETPDFSEFDVPTVTSILKLYLRELPESILTEKSHAAFEKTVVTQDETIQECHLSYNLNRLPENNFILLGWLMTHLKNVTNHERQNKMSPQNLAAVFSSVLHMSQKLLLAFLKYASTLFPNIVLEKYYPPIASTTCRLPEDSATILKELKKQESYLGQLHSEMNAGYVTKIREEKLWEVQRVITQLKRKLKSVEKEHTSKATSPVNAKSVEKQDVSLTIIIPPPPAASESKAANSAVTVVDAVEEAPSVPEPVRPIASVAEISTKKTDFTDPLRALTNEELEREIRLLQFKNNALEQIARELAQEVKEESDEVEKLKAQLELRGGPPERSVLDVDENVLRETIEQLRIENEQLRIKKNDLIELISEERKELIDLQARVAFSS